MNTDLFQTSGTSPTFEPLLSNFQAGKLLGLHEKTVDRLARSGVLPGFKIQKYWRFRASELESWLQSQRTSGKVSAPEKPSAHKKEKR